MAEIEAYMEATEPSQLTNSQLIRWNAYLRQESERLCKETAELVRQLVEARSGSQADREARRAALNLMEDAIAAATPSNGKTKNAFALRNDCAPRSRNTEPCLNP